MAKPDEMDIGFEDLLWSAEEVEDDGEPFAVKYPRWLAELEKELAEGERLTAVVREKLGGLHHGA